MKMFWSQLLANVKNKALAYVDKNSEKLVNENRELKTKVSALEAKLANQRQAFLFSLTTFAVSSGLTGLGCYFGYLALRKDGPDYAPSEWSQYQLVKEGLLLALARGEITQAEFESALNKAHFDACRKCNITFKIEENSDKLKNTENTLFETKLRR